VNLCNSLPVSAPTVNSLKGRFDRHCSHLRFSFNCENLTLKDQSTCLSSTAPYDDDDAGADTGGGGVKGPG